MKMCFKVIGVLVVASVCVFAFNSFNNKILSYEKAPKTYDNLLAAVQGETTATEKYVQFAQIAQEEGNTAIARLFLATAQAERIHIEKEYAIANTMKTYSKPVAEAVTLGTSQENLQSCIDGENYESQTMYPEFLAQANADGFNKAEKIFKFAKGAEASHAVVFAQELELLQQSGTYTEDVAYYICPVCGKLEKGSAPLFCSICGSPGLMFDKF